MLCCVVRNVVYTQTIVLTYCTVETNQIATESFIILDLKNIFSGKHNQKKATHLFEITNLEKKLFWVEYIRNKCTQVARA